MWDHLLNSLLRPNETRRCEESTIVSWTMSQYLQKAELRGYVPVKKPNVTKWTLNPLETFWKF